jgi:hypothetical protein
MEKLNMQAALIYLPDNMACRGVAFHPVFLILEK